MKRKVNYQSFLRFYTVFIVSQFLLGFTANAQWVQQNSTTTESLRDIYCVSADTCYVAGYSGIVLKTTDGGQNWVVKNSGINGAEPLQAVWCINGDICFTGATNLYKTIDGGNSWIIKSTPLTTGVASLFFVNDSVGYATGGGGGQIVRTTDVGETWNWSAIIGPNGGVSAVYFTDEDIGYAVENAFPDGRIWKTINGGGNWTQMYVESGIALYDIDFASDSVGFAVGETGTIVKTTDYGNSWTTLNSGVGNILYTIDCIDEDTCYTAGTPNPESMVFKTTDGGSNWQPDTAGITTTGGFWAIHFPTLDVGYVVGSGGKIFKKGNGVGIEETIAGDLHYLLYPNPANEYVILDVQIPEAFKSSKVVFKIYDMLGKKMNETVINNERTVLSIADMPSGIYLCALNIGREVLVRGKLVIQ